MASLTATDWVMAAARTLSAEGVDHIRIEVLARDLKVSKGSFYWHFANRDALLAALLAMWESLGTEAIIADVEAQAANAPDRVNALIARTFDHPEYDGTELGIRAWAQRDPDARAAVERVDARRIGYVHRLLTDCGVDPATAKTRTEFLYRTLIGEFVLRSHGSPPLPKQALRELGDSLIARSH
jgi:AcrR family transcriptional regulator